MRLRLTVVAVAVCCLPFSIGTRCARSDRRAFVLFVCSPPGVCGCACLLSSLPQGENNAAYPQRYNCSFPALIHDWRAKWAKYTDGATADDFPFGWAQINTAGSGAGDYKNPVFNNMASTCGHGCTPTCNTTCLRDFHEWADYNNGFTGIRYAQANTLRAVPNTFQAVIIDTPCPTTGSIHSPFKQPAGRRLARGGLAVAYGMKGLVAVDPKVESVKVVADTVVVTVGGLGSAGLTATIGSVGFEVLGNCSTTKLNELCWQSTPITSATATTVTLSKLPAHPRAVRFLWYIAPYPLHPGTAPIYAKGAPPMPAGAVPLPDTFDDGLLPLGPFLLPLAA